MNELEKMVWAAAFANEFSKEHAFRMNNYAPHLPIDGISGFSCAEIADLAVDKLREALSCDDAEYLTPGKEAWIVRTP